MRVASSTKYMLTVSRLNRVTDEMLNINNMITTGKKINQLSDDPVGLGRVASLKSSLVNMDQMQRNIASGRTWLETSEMSLSTVSELAADAKTLSILMNNGIMSESDRKSGSVEIAGILDQVLSLANSTVQGNYIFSGTKTDVKAYSLETTAAGTKAVYGGNDSPFKIKMAKESDIEVGQDGSDIFSNAKLVINETNNKIDFMEDPATGGAGFYGAQLTVTISNGEYSPDELAVAVSAAMTARSAAVNQPEIVEVTQSDATFIVEDYSALTMPGAGIDLTYTAATNTWAVTGAPLYPAGVTPIELESDASTVALDFTGDGIADVTANFDSDVADAYSVSFDITAAAAGGNDVEYGVTYDTFTEKYAISQTGGPALDSLKLMWSTGSNTDTGLGVDMGFDVADDDTGLPDGTFHVSDTEVEWGIFSTLIDLQGYLENNDTDGINRSIARLTADFDHIGSFIAESGIKQQRVDIRDNVIENLKLSYEINRMEIEDADAIETFSMLQQKEFAYQAALSSTSKILKLSLLDYI